MEEKIARVSDILEQIQALNELLEFQRLHEADRSTTEQYEFMKQEFISELNLLLKDFKLRIEQADLAA